MEEEVNTPEIEQDATPVQQTRADRIREASLAPDFSMPKIRRADDFFSESVMQLDNDTINEIMRETGFSASTGEQVNTAVKNAYIGMNQLGDEMKIAYGNLSNYVTGGRIGDEIAETAYRSIAQRYNEMANREEAIGGITSDWAKLAGGATSFTQLALEGLATAGVLPLAHIGIQEFGQGTYNDMKAYADKHDGSLKGYEPKGFDIAANTANTLLQVGIESYFGVGSPRFFVGASRGLVKEGASGALQEFTQGVLSDLNEVAKGNQEVSIMLENAEDYLRDAVVGGFLQGSLGALTHHQNYARAVNTTAEAIAKAHGQEEPTAKDKQAAKAIIDAKERGYASVLTNEFKAAFDASTGEGKLQAKIAKEIKRAVEAKELDLDTADETELAQRIEQIATQETLNAMDFAKEQNRSIADMELNNIVYKDNALYLEGFEPEVGDRAVSRARVLAERQSGLAELQTRIDANTRELQQLKADLAEAKAQKQESRAQVLQARIDKQNAIAEKNRLQAQKLEAQTSKLEKQIAKQTEQVKVAEPVKAPVAESVAAEPVVEKPAVKEPVKMAEVKTKKTKPVTEKKSLKQERTNKKKTLTREQVIENMTNGSDRFLKIIIPTEGNSFIAANKETLDKIDMFAQADFLQRAVANDKTTPDMIGEIFNFVENMPQGNYLSNVYYDIMVKPTTPTDVALKAKDKYNRAMVDSTTQEDWAGKTPSEIATEKIKTVFGVFQSEIKKYEKKGVITDTDAEEKDADFAQIGSELLDKELLEYIFMKYNFDPRVIEWIRDNPNLLQNNEEQEDSWEIGSGSNLVDILGEPLDYAPDGLKQIDIYDEKEPEFDYETTVYKMPQTQEEFENKIVSAMYKQTAKGLDLQETELQDATPNDDRTPYLFQGSISGKGDTARGGYDEQLKRIILGEKSDLSTIQHEFAHYWIQNNFKWARSGLASQDWLRRWRDVEEWLGIEPQDRLLSKSASEKFAKAYERYILEGKVAPELQWAFEGFQKAYQDIYDDLENDYFDLSEELAPEVVDWFNRNKEQSPKRLLQADEKKLEKALTLAAGGAVVEQTGDNTVVMTENNSKGEPVVTMGVKQSEVPQGDNLLVYSDKTTASKLQQSARKFFGDDVQVQQLATLDTEATLENFTNWIKRDRAGAWDAMMSPNTSPIYQAYLYKAFAQEAMNDASLAVELANVNIAKSAREMGQALQALNINNESGFDMMEIIRNLEKSKGEISQEEINNSIAESGVFDVELSEEETNELENQTECKL